MNRLSDPLELAIAATHRVMAPGFTSPEPAMEKITLWARGSRVAAGGLAGDTQLTHAGSGWTLPLRAVVMSQNSLVPVLGEAGVPEPALPIGYVAHDARRMYRLTTYTGRSIEATAEHRFLTQSGWRPLYMLGADDAVAVVVAYPALFGQGRTDPDALKLMAYLTANEAPGDGTTAVLVDPEVRADFEAAVLAKDDECCRLDTNGDASAFRVRGLHGGRSRTLALLEMVGALGGPAAERYIADFVFGLRLDRLRLFLSRVFTADAAIETSGCIRYRTASHRKARQLQHLMARFGVHSLVRGLGDEDKLEAIDLVIATKPDVIRFIDEIGFIGTQADRAEQIRAVLCHQRMIEPEHRRGPIHFDRVVHVEESDIAPVYELLLDGPANFIANDFVVRGADWLALGAHPSAWPEDETTVEDVPTTSASTSDLAVTPAAIRR